MKKGRIIIVDDEENIRGALQGILSDEGYHVSCAADGESALRMIQSEAPDLVLLDIWIPGIDGIQTLKILKKIDPDTEVVMMSGHGAIETAVKATKFGAFDFIEKPFSLDTILRTVAMALKNRRGRIAAKKAETSALGGGFVERQFIGSSREAKEIRRLIRKAARRGEAALIYGEEGSGKKFVARLIHNLSSRRDRPFIEISCKTLASEGLEDTLFGKEGLRKTSKFELADGGTIFLDRIDKLPAPMRGRLRDILEKRKISLNGEEVEITLNAVFLASSEEAEAPGGEDGDFYSLFNTAAVKLVPLRKRKSDIPEYVEHFVDEFCDEFDKHIENVDKGVLKALGSAPWPGNIRQLKQVVEQAVLSCDGPALLSEHLPPISEGNAGGVKRRRAPKERSSQPELPLPAGKDGQRGWRVHGKHAIPQRTLKTSVVLCGQGLHSGIKTGLILSPLPPDSGIIFGDISTGARVPALLENVRSTEYATTLSNGHVTIKTIEHILSAMHSYRITNALIKIGDEAPIMDGSALDFCQLIENSGIEEQDGYVDEIVIDTKISVGDPDEGPYLAVEPADRFSIHYYLDYPPPIGVQEHDYVYQSGEHYKETIAPARTFGFLKDIKALEESGLASGGKLSNVVLIDDEKVVNTPLRFPDEPARHKILDLIGDVYLLGRPIRGRFIAKKSGHTQNVALIKKIYARMGGLGRENEKRYAVGR